MQYPNGHDPIDETPHNRAMKALQAQKDHEAVREGIDDMEAGRVTPIAEADAVLRKKLGFPVKKQ